MQTFNKTVKSFHVIWLKSQDTNTKSKAFYQRWSSRSPNLIIRVKSGVWSPAPLLTPHPKITELKLFD